jgi:pyruvyl transferase EpsO
VDSHALILAEALRGLLPENTRVALALYPDHWNAGDPAIWWSTRRLLDHLKVRVDYTCDYRSYHPGALARAVPEGSILLCGGGNFGDVYRNEGGLRSRIFKDFPRRRIVQLPQSLWFRRAGSIPEMARAVAGLSDFTLLARDRASLDLAQGQLGCRTILTPDTACWLPDLSAWREKPVCDVLALWRVDAEGTRPPPEPLGFTLEAVDWMVPRNEGRRMGLRFALLRALTRPPGCRFSARLRNAWEPLAVERVRRGCRFLSRGRVVISNRLHTHFLCARMGLPHVMCDNEIGKLSAYFDTWPGDPAILRWATDAGHAAQLARAWLAVLRLDQRRALHSDVTAL